LSNIKEQDRMVYSRREFGRLAVAAGSVAALGRPAKIFAAGKPDSKFDGVQIGVISYSYRQMPEFTATSVLRYAVENGISAVELENVQEEWAGGPKRPMMGRPPAAASAAGPGGPSALRSGMRRQMSPEQQAAMQKFTADMTVFRTSVPMSKYEELRKMYADQGVSIYAFKATITMPMSNTECDAIFNAAKACGANQLTMEMPDGNPELTKKIGTFAEKHKMMVGYHAHLQATPTTWDEAMSQSPYNGINLDLGHFVAAGNSREDTIAFLKRNHTKITSMHLKDRKTKANGEANMLWGEGDTPIVQALQLMKKEGYKFPATIELEYQLPPGSDSVKEVGKCFAFAKNALA
jgi:sugar phosphate isomerase/epimerase